MSMPSSHSALYRTSSRSSDRIRRNCSSRCSANARTASFSRRGRVSDFPDGSPHAAVKSPTIRTAVWPASWNCRSLCSTTAQPSVTSEAVGSRPSFTRSGASERELLLEPALGNDVGRPVLQRSRGSGAMATGCYQCTKGPRVDSQM
jgi:hypothetical protein